MILRTAAIVVIVLPCQVALAQSDQIIGANCKPRVTVQKQDCAMATYYECPGEEATVWRSDVFFDGQPVISSLFDADYNLISSELADGSISMQANQSDGIVNLSMANLLAEGHAAYAKSIRMQMNGSVTTLVKRGEAVVQPEPVIIDGMEFRQIDLTEFQSFRPDGFHMTAHVRLFLNDEIGFPIEGQSVADFGSTQTITTTDPVLIALPGQPGFGATEPQAYCGPVTG